MQDSLSKAWLTLTFSAPSLLGYKLLREYTLKISVHTTYHQQIIDFSQLAIYITVGLDH